jgi:hypothetical protein
MSAEIIYFNSEPYWDRQDEKRFALAEALGLDADYELVSLPFPGDPEAARMLGVLARRAPKTIPLDFAPATGDLALYIGRGMNAELVAQLTGLDEPRVSAFYDSYESVRRRKRALSASSPPLARSSTNTAARR